MKRIGDYLVRIGAMTEVRCDVVTRLQEVGDTRRFGEIAVALGYVTEEDVQHYVELLKLEDRK